MPTSIAPRPLTAAERATWQRTLRTVRETLVADLARAARDAFSDETAGGDPTAVAQPATVELEEADNARELIAEVDHALAKLDGRASPPFGVCERTGKPIERDRLLLVPWTRWCAAAARSRG